MTITVADLACTQPTPQHDKPAMSDKQVKAHLAVLPEWELEDDSILKQFNFENYYETIAFVNMVASISHATDHHPELHVVFNSCLVLYRTHDVNQGAGGISMNDFICAAKIEATCALINANEAAE